MGKMSDPITSRSTLAAGFFRQTLRKIGSVPPTLWRWAKSSPKMIWPEAILIALAYPVSQLSGLGSEQMLVVTLLLIFQNASFTLVSRARQSANLKLHAIFAIGSNGFFIFVIATVAANYNDLWLKLWYIVCTVVGSVHAHYISLHKIETHGTFRKDSLVTRAELDLLIDRVSSLESKT